MTLSKNQAVLDSLCCCLNDKTGLNFYPQIPQPNLTEVFELSFPWRNEDIIVYFRWKSENEVPDELTIHLLVLLAQEIFPRLYLEFSRQKSELSWDQLMELASIQHWDEEMFEQMVERYRLQPLPLGFPLLIQCKSWQEEIPNVVRNLIPNCWVTWISPPQLFLFVPVKQKGTLQVEGESYLQPLHSMLADELGVLSAAFVGMPTQERLWQAYQKVCNLAELHNIFSPGALGSVAWKLGLTGIFSDISAERVQNFYQEVFKANPPEEFKQTLDLYFSHDLNISETARTLYLHRNTLLYRLDRINELTGYNPRVFKDAVLLYLALWLKKRVF